MSQRSNPQGFVTRIDRWLTSPDARAVYREKLTYLRAGKMRRLQRAAKSALGVAEGCVVEFGLALGGSGIVLAKLAQRADRVFHGFDVFGMIPPPNSAKDDDVSRNRYSIIASGQSKGIGGDLYYGYRDDLYGDVCRAFARHGVPVDGKHVQLHEGLFEATLRDFSNQPIAFAHLDCDWYDPVALCLTAVHARSTIGTTIVLDDYNDYAGCRSATDEFLAAHSEYNIDRGRNAILTRFR